MKLPPLPGLIWIVVLWAMFYAMVPASGAEAPRPDMRVLIDISGSMKKTDPENLRVPAVKLLLNLAQDGNQFGVWSFGRDVNNLVPLATVSPQWKQQTVSKVNAINSAGLFTNVGLVLEKAMLGQSTPDPAWDRTIVLLSDGMVDISKNPKDNVAERQRILDKILPRLKQAGFKIHSVALSEQADQAFLKTLAQQTNGSFSLARNADELLKTFVAASDKVNEPIQVPLEGNVFEIDPSINEFTALIFRQSEMNATRLVSPDGVEYSLSKGSRNVSWFADKRYDLITVYNPAAGKWNVIADLDPSNRVTVVSDLNVVMEGLPEHVLEGERVTMNMHFDEQGRVITNPRFLEILDITFRQDAANGETFEGKLSHNGKGEPQVPEDGVYSAKLGRTLLEGQHNFTILVDGKTFKRKKSQTLTVHHDVLDVEQQYRDEQGALQRYLVTQPRVGLAEVESLGIVAQITAPNGEKSIQNGVAQGDGTWRVDVPPYGELGLYEVLIKVNGNTNNGKPFELMQGPYSVDYRPLSETAMIEEPAIVSPEVPIETFDPATMEIPSLDVEDLPPDDVPPLQEEAMESNPDSPVVEEDIPSQETTEAVQEEMTAASEGGDQSWLLLASVFILGNALIIAAGVFYYIKFLRKTDAEQSKVMDEITQIQQSKRDVAKTTAVAEPEPTRPEVDITEALDEEEMTQIRPSEPDGEAVAQPEKAPEPVPEPPPPPVPEEAYSNEAAPLELDDDEFIEIEDDLDEDDFAEGELAAEAEGLDDLEMMLSEQEEATEEQLNQTIDDMLEQPTVFPDAQNTAKENDEKPDKLADSENPKKQRKDASGFDNDEFMLDNTDNK